MRAQLPRYQRSIPRQGQATASATSVGPVGGIMAPQQPGMMHPVPGNLQLKVHKYFFISATNCYVTLNDHVYDLKRRVVFVQIFD